MRTISCCFQRSQVKLLSLVAFSLAMMPLLHEAKAQSSVTIQASASPNNGHAPLTVLFNASGSPPSAPYSSPATYSWIFGDGSTGIGPKTKHIYARPGTYETTLTYTRFINVIDPPERQEHASKTIIITVQPSLSLVVFPSQLQFRAEESGNGSLPAFLTVSNASSTRLLWSVSSTATNWLSLSSIRGLLAGAVSTQLEVRITDSSLKAGVYHARLSFTSRESAVMAMVPSQGNLNTPLFVDVTLTVVQRPQPATNISIIGQFGSPPMRHLSWLKWTLLAIAVSIGLAGIIRINRKPSNHSHKHSNKIEVKMFYDTGKQRVNARHSLLASFLRVQIKEGSSSIHVQTQSHLINKITKLEN
jgi:PKD repeat protein